VPNGNLRLRERWRRYDARWRYDDVLSAAVSKAASAGAATRADECRCGDIMAGIAEPKDCRLFAAPCTPATPIGACMVSSEGTCRITHEYGGHPILEAE
jgi:hydrogenase expression/formation protein HypD